MATITLSGGFHDVSAITIRVSEKAVDSLFQDVDVPCGIGISTWADKYLSEHQIKRLENHFCGMSDCCCWGFTRKVNISTNKGDIYIG